jgi:hypothetical protein
MDWREKEKKQMLLLLNSIIGDHGAGLILGF